MAHPFLEALAPVAEAIGAEVVVDGEVHPGDIPLVWKGRTVGHLRLEGVGADIDWHMRAVERELGAPLGTLSREDKQRAVKILNERGAFGLRRSVEEVAEAMGVSRFTVYNYLNRPEERPAGVAPGAAAGAGTGAVRSRRR